MRPSSRTRRISALVVATCAALGAACSPPRFGTAQGHLLRGSGSGDTVFFTGLRSPHIGDHVYFLEPDLENTSDTPLTITDVTVTHIPAGLQQVSQRLYRLPADGIENVGWKPGSGEQYNPAHLDPKPVVGVTLAPHTGTPGRMLMVEFIVRSPGTYAARDVTIHYRAKGHTYQQTYALGFRIENAQP